MTKFYCINLDRRPDRWAKMVNQFNRHGLRAERLAAVDGKTLGVSDSYKAGWMGCLLSHINFLKTVANGTEPCIVLEDDAVLHPDFVHELEASMSELPDNAGFCYLGGSNIEQPSMVSSRIGVCRNTLSTVGYWVTPHFCKEVMLPYVSRLDKEVDATFVDLQSSHKMYIVSPRLVYQDPDYSDIQQKQVSYWHQRDF